MARQSLLQLTRFLPAGRALIAVADSAFAALELLTALRAQMTVITRLRLDAQLFAPPPPRSRGRAGRPRVKGERPPSLNSRLQDPRTRWRRIRLRRWYGQGARLIEISSGEALWYHAGQPPLPIRTAAWYAKPRAMFADALALVRAHLWRHTHLRTSDADTHMTIISRHLFRRLHDAACHAA